MRYLSVCSGIEAATVAWHPLGWQPVAFAEIDRFPAAVLAHHYPTIPNLGDITKFKDWPDAAFDVLAGGTPCQSFSVAGLRKGLADPRGNLALVYLAIADRYRPKWLVWENVPGVLSSVSHDAPDPSPPPPPLDLGRDGAEVETEDDYSAEELHALNCFLAGLSELGYGWAYGVRDAQHVRVDGLGRAVPQRRRRVFVVGYLGDWRRAAAVLFERESVCGHTPPRREAGEGLARDTAPSLTERTGESRGQDPLVAVAFGGNDTSGPIDVATARNAHGGPHGRLDFESETFVAHSLRASEDGTGRGTPLIAFSSKDQGADAQKGVSPTLRAMGHAESHANAGGQVAIAFDARQSDVIQYGPKTGPLDTDGHTMAVAFTQNSRSEISQIGGDGSVVGALAADHGVQQQNYVAWSIMPQNSGKDYKARAVEVAQPVMAGGPVGGNQGGDYIQSAWQVRRLTPRECERLQGFPDDYTLIPVRGKDAADGPRYKALGNSMACNVMRWIGRRIDMVEELAESVRAA